MTRPAGFLNIPQSMYVRVKRQKTTYFLHVEPTDTVLEVKQKLQELVDQVRRFSWRWGVSAPALLRVIRFSPCPACLCVGKPLTDLRHVWGKRW